MANLPSSRSSIHRAVLEMEFLPLWLCLSFHFLTVEWRSGRGTATAASQGGCKAVSFSLGSDLSSVPVLMRPGLLGKWMICHLKGTWSERVRPSVCLPSTQCAYCSLADEFSGWHLGKTRSPHPAVSYVLKVRGPRNWPRSATKS